MTMTDNSRPAVLVCGQIGHRIDLQWFPSLDGDGSWWDPVRRERHFLLEHRDGRHWVVYPLGGAPREPDGALVFHCCAADCSGEDYAV